MGAVCLISLSLGVAIVSKLVFNSLPLVIFYYFMIYPGMLIIIIFLIFYLKLDSSGDGLLFASKLYMGALPLSFSGSLCSIINITTCHSKVLYSGYYLLIKKVRIEVKFVNINIAK